MGNENKVVSKEKARYWVGILYPENMIEDWEDSIGHIVQVPYAYCIHNKDTEKDGTLRKAHVHLILAFTNTTTYNHALRIFKKLGENSINTCQSVVGIRYMYDYLIHDSEDCRKKNKHVYDVSERITGNTFDIGAYEQVSIKDKLEMRKRLANLIIEENVTNFADFYTKVTSKYDDSYFDIMSSYSNFFNMLITGNYHRYR